LETKTIWYWHRVNENDSIITVEISKRSKIKKARSSKIKEKISGSSFSIEKSKEIKKKR